MTDEVIILAGGLGTRLKEAVKDVPKPMAPIGNLPFLAYLFLYLKKFPINRVVLAVGHKHESISDYFRNKYQGMEIDYAIEKEPLGTGGAIVNALKLTKNNTAFLLNGDTFFKVDLLQLFQHHQKSKAQLTLALKPMQQFNRYGTVETSDSRIIKFNEKKPVNKGLINGGVYVIEKQSFELLNLPVKFSFEKEILEKETLQWNMQALICEGYFIDIGIPDDFKKAQQELPNQI
ncbi:MAG: D-glycero-D-manno-heptose 1-phosphate guanosyltransferase [Bacteroidetes bacterium HGW-Bacteroidetes-4]|jgi:D-glycero-alpha-D-manno-heptose 1-phosphate guanylyltransferase|nr:MAG: D-glycero-D-manno-heptose 1-phosphate guanosyltransferase [Bacteroidetes bacterium HGW-Bacteroidetes-4]